VANAKHEMKKGNSPAQQCGINSFNIKWLWQVNTIGVSLLV